jgi:hypothetical protein
MNTVIDLNRGTIGILKCCSTMSARRHEPRAEDAVDIGGFWIFGFLSVVLAVLKLTGGGVLVVVEGDAAIAGISGPQRAVYSDRLYMLPLVKDDEEESTSADEHSRYGYNIAALFFFFLFLDNLLRREEGQGWGGSGHAPGNSMWWSCISC